MNLEGLEMIAVLVMIVLFVKALEQFGLIDSGLEGKRHRSELKITGGFLNLE